jgi:hypothetical protein
MHQLQLLCTGEPASQKQIYNRFSLMQMAIKLQLELRGLQCDATVRDAGYGPIMRKLVQLDGYRGLLEKDT